jgi:hypothetical protein
MEVIVKFLAKSTIWVRALVYDEDDALVDPTTSIKLTLADPDGVQKAGYISVTASASFTAGLTVIGGTSEATGIVVSKPDATTLELKDVTGVWESGEAITDTGAGTSTTTSALLGADMTKDGANDGTFDYFYHTVADSPEGWWNGEVWVVDGSGESAKTSYGEFSVEVRHGL